MKLNLDTIRTLLLYLEENLTVSEDGFDEIDYTQISEDTNIAIPETINTLKVLDEAGFIQTIGNYGDNSIDELSVFRITYDGYQFIDSIRPMPRWKKILKVIAIVGSSSLNVVSPIASQLLSSEISEAIGRLSKNN
ncbi:DUF2513 domain-containing protein [Bilifractor porci]|uniref:DUF2513 domain-containing protein n=1 Tax=Bilifractor porci TaxID=2606636 RepID=A0A7X2P6L5_9FIRM|nr:DUF2513 domain-containing protein [Bilifractor porci]MST81164.1 DUF2513 domain-containing protein [Bilifractor porci]